MGQKRRPGGRYIVPLKSDGTEASAAGSPGLYTLSANTTYYYVLGGSDSPIHSFHLTGYTAAAVVTSATPQDCNHHEQDVTNISTTAGEWLSESPTTAYVSAVGTGWANTASSAVVTASGGGGGGALWHFADDGANRHRIAIVVGGTGGDFRGSAWGKE